MTAPLRSTLLRLTIDLSAQAGLEAMSLRQVAKTAGVSTTAIFQNFASKAALLESAVEVAIEADVAFHRDLLVQVGGLVATQPALADLMVYYVGHQARSAEARFLSQIVIAMREHPGCGPALKAWYAGRTRFWNDLLTASGAQGGNGAILTGTLFMEGLYAQALLDDGCYRLLLAETCRAICATLCAAPRADTASATVSETLNVTPFAVRPPAQSDVQQPGAEQLLDAAVQIINTSGMHALNQRALAARAGLSSSLIAYHFGDMKTLTIQAVWRALVQGIPAPLDPAGDASTFPRSVGEWFGVLEEMLTLGEGPERGFYIGVSQLSAEACFLAVQNPELVPLIHYLRGLEGWGTYRVSRALGPTTNQICRDQAAAFGVWIKSEALLRIAGIRDNITPVATAAMRLFGESAGLSISAG